MFGFSFSELIVVIIVAIGVMGPKDLPKMLRRVGQWAGKVRRMASDLRAQSGIDDALRSEGLADDIAEIRKLARGELDAVQRVARIDDDRPANRAPAPIDGDDLYSGGGIVHIVRDREYPRDGCDSYGAIPDNAIVYADSLPASGHARDALYALGDENAVLPPLPEPLPQEPAGGAVGPTLIGGIRADEVEKAATETSGAESEAPMRTDEDPMRTDEARASETAPTLIGMSAVEKPEPKDADRPREEKPGAPA